MRSLIPWCLALSGWTLLFAAGCTLRATTQEITDTTSNVTASTSGRIWWNEDGFIRPEHKAKAFAAYNAANLEQDIARGGGEYVTSLGALLGITPQTQSLFQLQAQEDFLTLVPIGHEARLRHIQRLIR